MYQIFDKTDKNGMRIILIPAKKSNVFMAMTTIRVGSIDENFKNNGISHFLEHMMFKETKNYKTMKLLGELDRMGFQYNAMTSHEYTGYYIKGHSDDWKKVIHLLSEIYKNPKFNQKDIDKEYKVVVDEMKMYETNNSSIVNELTMKHLYENQSAGLSILGDRKVLKKLNREDFVNYRNKYYVPSNTCVVICGNFPKNIYKQVSKQFTTGIKNKEIPRQIVKENQEKISMTLKYKDDLPQTILNLSFRTCGMCDDRTFTLDLISVILGKGMSSRLYKILREDHGLIYNLSVNQHEASSHGTFQIELSVDKKNIYKTIQIILNELKKLKKIKIGKDELNKAKKILTTSIALENSTPETYINYYGIQALFRKKLVPFKKMCENYKKITSNDIQKISNEFFLNKNMNLVSYGKLKPNKKLIKMFSV